MIFARGNADIWEWTMQKLEWAMQKRSGERLGVRRFKAEVADEEIGLGWWEVLLKLRIRLRHLRLGKSQITAKCATENAVAKTEIFFGNESVVCLHRQFFLLCCFVRCAWILFGLVLPRPHSLPSPFRFRSVSEPFSSRFRAVYESFTSRLRAVSEPTTIHHRMITI